MKTRLAMTTLLLTTLLYHPWGPEAIHQAVTDRFGYDLRPTDRHTEACQDSVPQAIAGGIAQARFGIPEATARQAWSYLPDDLREALTATCA